MVTSSGSPPQQQLFDEIVEQHGAALSRLCGGYERELAKREELLQEILLALWRSLTGFRGDCSPRTWMYRVAHNVATSYVHRVARQPRTSGDSRLEQPDSQAGPETKLDQSRRLERLHSAIQTLRPLDRQIILLYLEEIPQTEIAAITGISVDNVSTRVGRCRQQLARAMGARKPS